MKRSITAILVLMFVSSICLGEASGYRVGQSQTTYEEALSYCESLGGSLATEDELKGLYLKSIDQNGNSALRGGSRSIEFWIKGDKEWGLDTISLFPRLWLVLVLPSKQPRVMHISRYMEWEVERMYTANKRPWSDGDRSLAVCVGI